MITSIQLRKYKEILIAIRGIVLIKAYLPAPFAERRRGMYTTKKTLKSGETRYLFRERYVDKKTGRWQSVSITKTKNTTRARREAQQELDELIRQQEAKVDYDKLTLTELVELYYKDQQSTTKKSTHRRNYYSLLNTVKIIGGDVLCNSVTANLIKSKLQATGDGACTLNERILRLKAMLRWAYRNDIIADISYINKLERYKDMNYRVKIQDKFLEAEELVKVVDAMEVRKWKLMTRFMALSGLRVGEVIALQDSDVDLEQSILNVTKTYDTNNRIVTSAKTGDSMREVYIQKELALVCREIRTYMKEQRFKNRYAGQGLFFESEEGGYVQYPAFNKYLKETSIKVLGKKVTTHELRHTHCSLMIEAGVSIDAVSKRLGHNDSRITKNIYMHVTNKLKEQYNRQFDEVCIMS